MSEPLLTLEEEAGIDEDWVGPEDGDEDGATPEKDIGQRAQEGGHQEGPGGPEALLEHAGREAHAEAQVEHGRHQLH